MDKLILAGQTFDVPPPPFGKLRKCIASFNRMRVGGMESDTSMDEIAVIFSLLVNKSVDEIDCMDISFKEMTVALGQVPTICGLVERSPESGEAQVATDGIPSTAT